ncbi:ISL3 family transposase [Lactobacillus johnsonii]|jgi:transposase|uniref:ISL3 family transposase n=1 Tax=Lactobacillus johnsonii TaxID=33959 RepID=UPI001C106D49|nr:ISL3 family transposase [Lactobacillus johnsonii]MBU5319608.1 ISL3 family transposase [Lactobacillus johnsonii]
MSQDNSILCALDIKDNNMRNVSVKDATIKNRGVIKHIKIVSADLIYKLYRCPQCGLNSLVKNGKRKTNARLASFNGIEYHLVLNKQRYICKNCGSTCGAHSDLLIKNHTMTKQVQNRIFDMARESLTLTSIAKIIGVSVNTVSRILYDNIKLPNRCNVLPENLCFDEFRSVNGIFTFIAIDAQTHHLIELIHDRLSKTVTEHFINNYSLSERQAVKTVSIDLNANYQMVVHRIFPNAQIIVDRFHIVQLCSRALDQVRISCLKKISDKHSRLYKALKSNWRLYHLPEADVDDKKVKYIFGINEYTTTQNVIDIAIDSLPIFKNTYDVYQGIQKAIHEHDIALLEETIYGYKKNNTVMDTSISTLRKNLNYVRNSCTMSYSNGPLEGTIGKIKKLKHISYGFKSLDHFLKRIRLICA